MDSKVSKVLSDWSNRPFRYGSDNCCEFVGDVLQSMFGRNPMDAFHYTTAKEAQQAIAEHGTLVDAINRTLGDSLPLSKPFLDGDVVVCKQEDESWIAGVIIDQRIALKSPESIMDWPIEWVQYRWRMAHA